MPLSVETSPVRGTQHCCQQSKGFRAALISQRSILHFRRKAFGLSRDRCGGTLQRLLRQSELQVVWQAVPLDPAIRSLSDEHGGDPIWRMQPILTGPS